MDTWRFFTAFGMLEFRMTNLSSSEIVVVRRYLGILTSLELSIPEAASRLDTDQAAIWTRNKAEILDRTRLFTDWCRRLSAFIGVPLGPSLTGATGRLVI